MGQQGPGIFCPEYDGVHPLRGEGVPAEPVGAVGLPHQHLPRPQAVHQPRGVPAGDIRAAGCGYNHGKFPSQVKNRRTASLSACAGFPYAAASGTVSVPVWVSAGSVSWPVTGGTGSTSVGADASARW